MSKFLTGYFLVEKFFFEVQCMNINAEIVLFGIQGSFLEDEQSLKCFRVMNLVGTHSEELPCITDSKEKDVEARITKHTRIYVYTGQGWNGIRLIYFAI